MMDTNTLNDIRDIKGLVPVPPAWWPLWVALGVLGLALLGWWLWRRHRRASAEPIRVAAPQPTPYDLAVAALDRLRAANLAVEPFYTQLSAIVRQYIEGRFGLHAPERTTEEFLAQASLPPEQMALLAAFLGEADLVKFARHQPGPEDCERAWAAARKFVEETGTSAPTPGQVGATP